MFVTFITSIIRWYFYQIMDYRDTRTYILESCIQEFCFCDVMHWTEVFYMGWIQWDDQTYTTVIKLLLVINTNSAETWNTNIAKMFSKWSNCSILHLNILIWILMALGCLNRKKLVVLYRWNKWTSLTNKFYSKILHHICSLLI